jgi:hypothetical protein
MRCLKPIKEHIQQGTDRHSLVSSRCLKPTKEHIQQDWGFLMFHLMSCLKPTKEHIQQDSLTRSLVLFKAYKRTYTTSKYLYFFVYQLITYKISV